MIDLVSLKKNIFNLLRDPALWAKFSANTAGAIEVSKSWKVTLNDEQARVLLAVLGQLQFEISEAIVDFLNHATLDTETDVLLIDGNTNIGRLFAANGVRGGGGGPKQWIYNLMLSVGPVSAAGKVISDVSRASKGEL